MRPKLLILILAASFCAGIGSIAGEDLSKEPPLAYTLILGEKRFPIELEKDISLAGEFKDPKARLEAAKTRIFNFKGIKFEYPAAFGWEAEIDDPNPLIWTLSGNDLTVMIFHSQVEIDPRVQAREMAEQLGQKSPKMKETERQYGGQKLKGIQFKIAALGAGLSFEILAVPLAEGHGLIVIQDSADDKDESAECKTMRELFTRTLSLTPKKPAEPSI